MWHIIQFDSSLEPEVTSPYVLTYRKDSKDLVRENVLKSSKVVDGPYTILEIYSSTVER